MVLGRDPVSEAVPGWAQKDASAVEIRLLIDHHRILNEFDFFAGPRTIPGDPIHKPHQTALIFGAVHHRSYDEIAGGL